MALTKERDLRPAGSTAPSRLLMLLYSCTSHKESGAKLDGDNYFKVNKCHQMKLEQSVGKLHAIK